jgi:hypothetical protein
MSEAAVAQNSERRAWFARQLDDAGWTNEHTPVVRYLADQFLGLGVIGTHADTAEFATALNIIDELLRGRALKSELWSEQKRADDANASAVWIAVQPGAALNRQDRVRVQNNAYEDENGRAHNGRSGTVMAVRYGMAVVHYDGDPPGTGQHHNIRLLEKRVLPQ